MRAFASAPETVDDNRPGARPFALTSRARRHYDVGSRLNASMKRPARPPLSGVAFVEHPAIVASALAELVRRVPVSA